MPTYAIKAPNGKTYQIDGPAGASDDAVRAQVLKQFPEAAGARSAKPATVPNKAANVYNTYRSALAKRAAVLGPEMQQRALDKFDTDPRMQQLRASAGLAPVMTRKQAVQETARRVIKEQRETPSMIPQGVRDTGASFIGAANDALFGAPARIAAKITGVPNDVMQEFADQSGQRAPVNNFIQTLGLGLLTGAGEAKLAGYGAGKLAASGAPLVAKTGKLIQEALTIRRGQKAANAAKIVGTAAGAGATEAAIKDRSITEGALTGAAGAGVLIGGAKLLNTVLIHPASEMLRMTGGKAILREYVKTPIEEIQRRAAAWRARTGTEPTIFEILPQEDRESVRKMLKRAPGTVRESTAQMVNQRGAEIGPDIAARTEEIIRPAQTRRIGQIATDLAASRNGPGTLATVDELNLANNAARAPLDMAEVRRQEAHNIMAPFDNIPVVNSVADLLPHVPSGTGRRSTRLVVDPEVARVINSVAGTRRLGTAITVRDITDMVSDLRDDVLAGGIEGRIAQRAVDHLTSILPSDAQAAAARMTEAFAARSRMKEGVTEGLETRLRENVNPGSARAERAARNAYDMPEGTIGRALGQAARIEQDVMNSPNTSLRAIQEIADNPTTQEAISRNLGGSEGQQIADAARAQTESARNLLALKNVVSPEDTSSLATMARGLLALTPGAMATTRFRGVQAIGQFLHGLPEGRAQTIMDALFSRNPTRVSRALRWFNNQGDAGQQAIAALRNSLVAGGVVAPAANKALSQPDTSPEVTDIPAQLTDAPPAEEQPIEPDSPYSAQLQDIYDNESPELLDLVDRVEQQESGGDQSAVSSAGAVGVMQVMPDTAPEAAKLAGVKWDPQAYRSDANYNRLLGIAYLSEMLRRYDGDVEKALAAYNAGPGSVENALATNGDNWLAALPGETQDYVARIS